MDFITGSYKIYVTGCCQGSVMGFPSRVFFFLFGGGSLIFTRVRLDHYGSFSSRNIYVNATNPIQIIEARKSEPFFLNALNR